MVYGSRMATGLELDESTGDVLLDLVMARLPKFALMDKIIEHDEGVEIYDPHSEKKYCVPYINTGNEKIPLLAKPDTAKVNYSAFKEYKTSTVKWTQSKADESGQITFYTLAIWLKTGKLPQDIELVNATTEYTEDGKLQPTGEIYRFKTQRTLADVLQMQSRVKKTWSGIKKLVEEELI